MKQFAPDGELRKVSSGRQRGAASAYTDPPADANSGFVLLSVLFLVALIVLFLSLAAPRMADEIRRDREEEFFHRGLQYQRAIKLYYRKFGRYPVSLDELEKTNEVRFLRKRYFDPITGNDQWRLIHLGEAKVPPMGLFGQPLTIGVPAGFLGAGLIDMTTLKSGIVTVDPTSPGLSQGLSDPTAGGTSSAGSGSGGSSTASAGTIAGTSADTSNLASGFIVGVSSNSPRESIRTYRQQTHYNEWEFVYDPSQDRGIASGAPPRPGLSQPYASPVPAPSGTAPVGTSQP